MKSAEVFYNREDLWQFPRQPTGGDEATMAPYYIIVRLPGEPQAEFLQMLPMVPSQRQNMIAWLAARSDPPDYGKLIVYEFPKDKLVYGPFQIEARINQNTEISQQLSLWNQMGSRVIRGNLLVIPIENSILYVSPLYLRAETGQLPELKVPKRRGSRTVTSVLASSTELKAWDYDGLIRFLVDYDTGNAISAGSDQVYLSRVGESPAAH
jgi:uncharacterized membrane protein (UPF0182 family)